MRNTLKSSQILRSKKRPRPTLRSGRGSRTNSNTSYQIPARVIEADKVNVHPVCDVLLVASQSHSLRSKPGEDHELLRATKESSIRRVAGLHRAPLHKRVGRRFARRSRVSSLSRSGLPVPHRVARAYALSVYKSPK